MKRVVVITGASSGIGLEAAKLFCAKGETVYNLSRSLAGAENVKNVACDVTNEKSVREAFEYIETAEGRIDVLVLNAGYGISGAVESTPHEQAEKQFDVNFFGAVRCVRHAAPLLRRAEKRSGKIVAVSSLAAVIPIPFQAFYSASKAAVSSLARALAAEMSPFGIKVSAVLPGDTQTGFTDKRQKIDEDALYSAAAALAVGVMEKDERKGMPPERIAELIFKISNKKNPRAQYTAGFGNKAIMLLQKIFPARTVDRIVRKKYM